MAPQDDLTAERAAKCVATVWTSFGNGHGCLNLCGRTGKVQANGKWYCKIHDPAAVEARKKKSEERYQEQSRKWHEQYARDQYDRKAGDICRSLGIADPAQLLDRLASEGTPAPIDLLPKLKDDGSYGEHF